MATAAATRPTATSPLVETPDPALASDNPEHREDRLLEAAKHIISRLEGQVQEQITAKSDIEDRWIEDLRHYYGKYEDTERADMDEAERSTAFVNLTRSKTDGWAARLSDLLMPTDGRNWGAEPTPLPKLAQAAKDALRQAQELAEQANKSEAQASAVEQANPEQAAIMRRQVASTLNQASAFADQAQHSEATSAEAKKRCKAMIAAIDDQLIESDYQAICREIIDDGCRLGTGILKGPLSSTRTRSEWRMSHVDSKEIWALTQIPDPMPQYMRVDPWHFFPDMSARTIAEAEFTYERSLPTKRDLRIFADKLGFSKNAVRRLLREGPGDSPPVGLNWLVNLRSITNESAPIKGRYVMWEYHGPLETSEVCILLRALGDPESLEAARDYEAADDPLNEPRVILHFCNGEALKLTPEYPLDSGDTLYSVWNFEKGETSIFGMGNPRFMYDSQRALNGAWRMMMDNSGLSVGPQILIDKGAVTPQDGSYDLKPLKTWLLNSSALSNAPNRLPFQAIDIPNNQNQIQGIIALAKQFIDDETAMPMIAQGEQGAASTTLGGMAMLFNSANVVFRDRVKSFDDNLTKPTIRRAYQWNMQHNPDQSIKGDLQVRALGTSVLLVREIQSQNLLNVMTNWTVHPVIGGFIKVREGLVKALETMMIPPDEVLYTQDEADKRLKEQAEARAAEAAAAMPKGDDPSMEAPAVAIARIRKETAQMEMDGKTRIAQAELDMRMAEMQERSGLSREELQAKFGLKRLEVESRERTTAAKIAVEERRGATAQAEGLPASAGTGVGVE